MQFTVALQIFAFLATGALADLHTSGYCIDIEPATSFRKGEVASANNRATNAACGNYRNRNTGGEWWDTCPDCAAHTASNGIAQCDSPAKHIGGDEWEYYCRQNGADGGSAD